MEPAAGGRHEVRGRPGGRLRRTAARTSRRHLSRPAVARGEEGASAADVCCPEPAGGMVKCPASHHTAGIGGTGADLPRRSAPGVPAGAPQHQD
ncbi:hypothetical protein CapIbe_014789 [Capra ibex]